MQFLVQMKLVAQGRPTSPEAEIALAENYIFPSVEMIGKLREEKEILAGGPTRTIVDSRPIVGCLVTSKLQVSSKGTDAQV